MCGINTTNLAWFANNLNGRKRYIRITECADTVEKDIKAQYCDRYYFRSI